MASLSHAHHGTASQDSGSHAAPLALTSLVVGVAILAAGVLLAAPAAQNVAPALLALLAAATVAASGAASDRGVLSAVMVAVIAILGVQLAPSAEAAELSRLVVGTMLGGLAVAAARLIARQS